MKKDIKSYVISVLIAVGTGALSALLTRGSMDIYETFNKPALAPPAILFPIVWTLLYTLMGISSAIVYNSNSVSEQSKNRALLVYGIQLAVNFFWSIIFFNFNAFLLSFIWLLLLWALVLIMIIKFSQINKTAAFLQIPYLLWLTFAGYLNLAVWLLNK